MSRFVSFWLALALLALSLSYASSAESKSLFNGRDFTGWVVMYGGEWTIEDDALVGRNGTNWTTRPEQSGSWLRTERQYEDFVLEVEYMITSGGNSGIHFRSALERNPTFTGYEMQIVDDAGKEPRKGGSGALYDVVAPTKSMARPAGEWNKARITCRGHHIEVVLNGEKVVDFTGDRRLKGYIGLQNHDAKCVVRFRNVRITEL